jgi:hypothetical protein
MIISGSLRNGKDVENVSPEIRGRWGYMTPLNATAFFFDVQISLMFWDF